MIQKVLVGIDPRVSRLGDGIVSHYTMAELIFSLHVGILIFHFHEWTQNKLLLETSKTEFFQICTKQQHLTFSNLTNTTHLLAMNDILPVLSL